MALSSTLYGFETGNISEVLEQARNEVCNYDIVSGTGTLESEDIVFSVTNLENKETEEKLVGDETARKP
jgi:hypothetical protein